jgi:hypothetical protein
VGVKMGVEERTISVRGVYSVTASYDVILKEINLPGIRIDIKVGNKVVPSKLYIFIWRLLQNKIPTRRGILNDSERLCVGDCVSGKSLTLLFLFLVYDILECKGENYRLVASARCTVQLRTLDYWEEIT